jgi:hypothetical protein
MSLEQRDHTAYDLLGVDEAPIARIKAAFVCTQDEQVAFWNERGSAFTAALLVQRELGAH